MLERQPRNDRWSKAQTCAQQILPCILAAVDPESFIEQIGAFENLGWTHGERVPARLTVPNNRRKHA